MPAATDRIEFAPPPPPGRLRALALAVLAHVLLMLALTWGITWNREAQDLSVEAELWARVPQEAAPAPTPPPVVQAPPVTPPAPPPAPPEPKAGPPAPPVVQPKPPDIALEREKRRQEEAERRREAQEKQKQLEARKHREELERKKELEARRQAEEQKKLEAKRKKEEQERREATADKKRAEEQARAKKQQEDARRVQALREENLRRMQNMANGTGGPSSSGTAARSAGPSESYAGRIRARVKPNIVFTDDIAGNPTAEIEVRMAPDGTITSKRVVKSSGVSSWDAAVLRALDKTEVLPRDIDGRVHSPLIIEFRPKG
ncbi:cell envelope integrity protein TolA [Ramlibacter sp.]|uniref:cell envelope integrity protein TolA n=1 Tax=Ramlibacter sp. TaxID=1917967 RepID=UPI002CE4EA55|nr:cell envelope integrity protein TolA [Ramlibacter sp.]HWI80930.1 cell envelope integrity protein TolA [Ramlibacter sp.]